MVQSTHTFFCKKKDLKLREPEFLFTITNNEFCKKKNTATTEM